MIQLSKKSGNKFLLAGIIMAVLAGLVVMFTLSMAVPSVSVVYVTDNLNPGDTLENNLAVKQISKSSLPPGALRKIEDLGKYHISVSLAEGDILRKSHVSELVDGGTLAARLDLMNMPDRVGYALEPDTMNGLTLKIGDKIQIAGVSQFYGDADEQVFSGKKANAEILVHAAPVLHVPGTDPKTGEYQGSVVAALTQEEFKLVSQAKKIGFLQAAVLPVSYNPVEHVEQVEEAKKDAIEEGE